MGSSVEHLLQTRNRQKNTSIIHWRQQMCSMIMDIGLTIWKVMCTIIHTEGQSTADQQYRQELCSKLLYLQQDLDPIHPSDYYSRKAKWGDMRLFIEIEKESKK